MPDAPLKTWICSLTVVLLTVSAGQATAQSAEEEASESPVATGLELQARLKTGGVLDRAAPTPGFAVGLRTDKLSLVGGVNWYQFKFSETYDDGTTFETSGNLFQVLPTLQYDVFSSEDERSRLGILGGVGFGRFRVSSDSDDFTATFVPIRAGVAGDYFLSRHFSLGLEAGAQFAVLTGLDTPDDSDIDVGFGANMFYGALRARFVL